MAPSSSHSLSKKLLIAPKLKTKPKPKPAVPPHSGSAASTPSPIRDHPNMSDCHCCGYRVNRANPKDRLELLDSIWRLVLLCRACGKDISSGHKCPYCFHETGNSGNFFQCSLCERKIHENCIKDCGNCTPWCYLRPPMEGFRVCVDCWVPDLLKHSSRVWGKSENEGGLKGNGGAKNLLERKAKDVKRGPKKVNKMGHANRRWARNPVDMVNVVLALPAANFRGNVRVEISHGFAKSVKSISATESAKAEKSNGAAATAKAEKPGSGIAAANAMAEKSNGAAAGSMAEKPCISAANAKVEKSSIPAAKAVKSSIAVANSKAENLKITTANAMAEKSSIAGAKAKTEKSNIATTNAKADKSNIATTNAKAEKSSIAAANAKAEKSSIAAANTKAENSRIAAANAVAEKSTIAAASAKAEKSSTTAANSEAEKPNIAAANAKVQESKSFTDGAKTEKSNCVAYGAGTEKSNCVASGAETEKFNNAAASVNAEKSNGATTGVRAEKLTWIADVISAEILNRVAEVISGDKSNCAVDDVRAGNSKCVAGVMWVENSNGAAGGLKTDNSKSTAIEVVDDAELAIQLHRAMNSSPRICRSKRSVDSNSLDVLTSKIHNGLAYKKSCLGKNCGDDQKLEADANNIGSERIHQPWSGQCSEVSGLNSGLLPYKRDRKRKIWQLNDEETVASKSRSNQLAEVNAGLHSDYASTRSQMKSHSDISGASLGINADQNNLCTDVNRFGEELAGCTCTQFKLEACQVNCETCVPVECSTFDNNAVPSESGYQVDASRFGMEGDCYNVKHNKRVAGTQSDSTFMCSCTFETENQANALALGNSDAGCSEKCSEELNLPNQTCNQDADPYCFKYAKRMKGVKPSSLFESTLASNTFVNAVGPCTAGLAANCSAESRTMSDVSFDSFAHNLPT